MKWAASVTPDQLFIGLHKTRNAEPAKDELTKDITQTGIIYFYLAILRKMLLLQFFQLPDGLLIRREPGSKRLLPPPDLQQFLFPHQPDDDDQGQEGKGRDDPADPFRPWIGHVDDILDIMIVPAGVEFRIADSDPHRVREILLCAHDKGQARDGPGAGVEAGDGQVLTIVTPAGTYDGIRLALFHKVEMREGVQRRPG